MVTIQYQISEDDFVAAGQLALKVRSRYKAAQRFILPILGILSISGYLVMLPWEKEVTIPSLLPLLMGILFLWVYFATAFHLRKQYRKIPLLAETRTLEADDHGLYFITQASESGSTWEPYTRFGEDARTFVLFQQGNQLFIPIPKGELKPDQIDGLRELFQSHLPRK